MCWTIGSVDIKLTRRHSFVDWDEQISRNNLGPDVELGDTVVTRIYFCWKRDAS
ncbi:hypothetical protein EYZ11_011026 [Aspergillus tanneri]|uniref:Uncharacterized protein n=1 Tax=Aspergillus tanneri TaxID=1220188 RepID=A0A4S3J615_9EURO|nr:hypothetical protein EYZ11_011026 [Aspergillus tanneri]